MPTPCHVMLHHAILSRIHEAIPYGTKFVVVNQYCYINIIDLTSTKLVLVINNYNTTSYMYPLIALTDCLSLCRF